MIVHVGRIDNCNTANRLRKGTKPTFVYFFPCAIRSREGETAKITVSCVYCSLYYYTVGLRVGSALIIARPFKIHEGSCSSLWGS